VDKPLKSVICQWDARPTVTFRAAYRASPPVDRYQVILLSDKRHMCVNDLPKLRESGTAGSRTRDLFELGVQWKEEKWKEEGKGRNSVQL